MLEKNEFDVNHLLDDAMKNMIDFIIYYLFRSINGIQRYDFFGVFNDYLNHILKS